MVSPPSMSILTKLQSAMACTSKNFCRVIHFIGTAFMLSLNSRLDILSPNIECVPRVVASHLSEMQTGQRSILFSSPRFAATLYLSSSKATGSGSKA